MVKPLSLKISNVRSYQEAFINYGDSKLVYYYGLNGSGKTTIARALLFLIGMEPEDGDIRVGSDSLEVEGVFDISDISSTLMPREDILKITVFKERGKTAKYRIGEDKRRVSHSRISQYFSSIGAAPSQVFIQMGSIPLPFRSAVEEHIKRRGLIEHRRRRFSALMNLMGIRDFIGVLEEKKVDYDRVLEIYKETKLDLIDVKRNFELVKAKYQRFLEFSSTKEEIERLRRLRKVAKAHFMLSKLKEIASQYGQLCKRAKDMEREIDEKIEIQKELTQTEHRLSEEYKRLSKQLEEFEIRRNRILSDIGKIDGELKTLGQVVEPVSEKYMSFALPQIETEIKKIDKQLQVLHRKKSSLKNNIEGLKGQRQSLMRLLKERKEELNTLMNNLLEPVDEDYLSRLSSEIVDLKHQLLEMEHQYKKWQKIKQSPVMVKDTKVADIVKKVISLFIKKDLVPLESDVGLPYPSLSHFVDTQHEDIQNLLKRVFIVKTKEEADIVRAKGALAIVDGEMWDWWGLWEEPEQYISVILFQDKVEKPPMEELREKLEKLEEEYRELQLKHKKYQRQMDRMRFIEADIRSLEDKLANLPDISDMLSQMSSLDKEIEFLKQEKILLEDTRRYLQYQLLIQKRSTLQEKIKVIDKQIPDKKKIESVVARLSSVSSERLYLEKELSRQKNVLSKMRREMLSLKNEMLDLTSKLSVLDKNVLKEAVGYTGELSVASIDRQIALLEAKLAGMGNVEDVTERYKELQQTVKNVENRFKEVEKWQQEALKDLEHMKRELINSIKQIESKITVIFSDFLSTFGFDGKVSIHIDTSAPKTVGDVSVSIRSRDGDVMRLSGGEGILVAFSLYLAAWMVKTGNVHFIMIDEAQTNLDKVNFGKLLRLLLDKVPGQIHIFTMVEPPKIIADRDDTLIYHIKRNIFDMASEVMKIE